MIRITTGTTPIDSSATAVTDGEAGQYLIIFSAEAGADIITIEDGSNVQLSGGVNYDMGGGDSLTLLFDSGFAQSFKIGRSNN